MKDYSIEIKFKCQDYDLAKSLLEFLLSLLKLIGIDVTMSIVYLDPKALNSK